MQTKACVLCGVQIHAASRRCTFCGSPQRRRLAGPRWMPWVAAVAAVVAVVAAIFATAGGGSGSGGPQFRLFQSDGLSTLVPVGWSRRPESAAPGTLKAAFDLPNSPQYQLAVTAVRPTHVAAELRATRLRAAAATRLGYALHFFGRVLFPGGRPAWLLAYEAAGFSHATYVSTACKPSVAMTVEVSAPSRSALAGLAEPIAASTGPQCE